MAIDQGRQLERTIFSITGGDGYAYVDFELSEDKISIIPVVKSVGDYPIYNLKVNIIDTDEFQRFPQGLSLKEFERQVLPNVSSLSLFVDEIPANDTIIPMLTNNKLPVVSGKSNYIIPFDNNRSSHKEYWIRLVARNGHLEERVRFVKTDGKWRKAIRLKRLAYALYSSSPQ